MRQLSSTLEFHSAIWSHTLCFSSHNNNLKILTQMDLNEDQSACATRLIPSSWLLWLDSSLEITASWPCQDILEDTFGCKEGTHKRKDARMSSGVPPLLSTCLLFWVCQNCSKYVIYHTVQERRNMRSVSSNGRFHQASGVVLQSLIDSFWTRAHTCQLAST